MKILTKTFFILFVIFFSRNIYAKEINLNDVSKKIQQANELIKDKIEDREKLNILNILNALNNELVKNNVNKKTLLNSLTIINSTNFLEENFPSKVKITFPKDFLIGSNLSVSDLTNASFFLNTLAKKKITNLKKSNSLASEKDSKLSDLQKESFKFFNTNATLLIKQLEKLPELDLVELSLAVEKNAKNLKSNLNSLSISTIDTGTKIENVSNEISSASNKINRASNDITSASTSISQASNELTSATESINQVSSNISSVANSVSNVSRSIVTVTSSSVFNAFVNQWTRKQRKKKRRRRWR